MANQWIEIFEHTARHTAPTGSENSYFLPVRESLVPQFTPTDEPREEFAGADTGLGFSTFVRREELWEKQLSFYVRPIKAVNMLLEHGLGVEEARSAVDTTAYEGLYRPINMPFGSAGVALANKALGLKVYYDDGEGNTRLRTYYGGRVVGAALELAGEGTDELTMTLTLQGPGECITSESDGSGATVPDPADLPTPFNFKDCTFYLDVITDMVRTGTAPSFTAFDPSAMATFAPDSMSISINPAREDKRKGTELVTDKTTGMEVTASFPVDLRDPSSGFSSHDLVNALIDGQVQRGICVVMDNSEVAGSTTQTYEWIIDLPVMQLTSGSRDHNTSGATPKTTLEMKGVYDSDVGYMAGIFTTDQVA
mgnify:FL=1